MLAYIERTPEIHKALQAIRLRLRDLRRDATTLGYGPRFQHSTGQVHKGGPNTGVFLQFVATDAADVPIPDAPYTFGVLKQAQALGDLQSLEAHGRRVIRLDLGADIAAGLSELREALDASRCLSRISSLMEQFELTAVVTLCNDEKRSRYMEMGIYGLGRMGGNMAIRLLRGGHRVVASNRSRGPVDEAAAVRRRASLFHR